MNKVIGWGAVLSLLAAPLNVSAAVITFDNVHSSAADYKGFEFLTAVTYNPERENPPPSSIAIDGAWGMEIEGEWGAPSGTDLGFYMRRQDLGLFDVLSFWIARVGFCEADVTSPTGIFCAGSGFRAVGYRDGEAMFEYNSGILDVYGRSEFQSLNFLRIDEFLMFSTAVESFYVSDMRVRKVPEPGTLALFGLGLLGMGYARRRKAS